MATEIRLARKDAGATMPERATEGSFGYDLAALSTCEIAPGSTVIVPTGWELAADLPCAAGEGVAMMILPRSSLSLKYGLILPNSPGLIDADYGGEIGILVHNLRAEPVTLAAGTRIAQAVFVRLVLPRVTVSNQDAARERGGFGSTGHGDLPGTG